MNIESLREFALSLEGTEECLPFGPQTLVFKIKQKIFLLAPLDSVPLSFNVKCDPDKALELRDRYPAITPGYHMSKKHWNTILVDGSLTDKQLREFVLNSYHLVRGKKTGRN